MAVIRLEEQAGYKDWLKNTNGSWQYDASMQATSDENPFIYLTNTGEDDAVFQIALSKLVDIQLIRKNSILVTPSVLDKAKGIKVELRDQSQSILATSKPSLNSKTWIHLLVNAENIALDITELWITFVLPAGASTIISGIQGQILTQDQTVVDSIKVEATDQDAAIDLTQAKLNASKYFVKFAPESWWRADGVLKAKQLLTVDPLDITVNVAEAMDKTFYVDAVNGDDNNDGSESAPFKTLQKAINSVPVGGRSWIYVVGDYSLESSIFVYHKNLHIELHGKLTPTWETAGGFRKLTTFHLYSSSVEFIIPSSYGGKIEIPAGDSTIAYGPFRSFCVIKLSSYVSFRCYIEEDNYHPIIVNDGALLEIYQSNAPSYGGLAWLNVGGYFSGSNRQVVIDIENSAWLVYNPVHCPMAINFSYSGGLSDISGNSLDLGDVISGILKDANSVPRNLVCSEVI